jgi:hypothetical protein
MKFAIHILKVNAPQTTNDILREIANYQQRGKFIKDMGRDQHGC